MRLREYIREDAESAARSVDKIICELQEYPELSDIKGKLELLSKYLREGYFSRAAFIVRNIDTLMDNVTLKQREGESVESFNLRVRRFHDEIKQHYYRVRERIIKIAPIIRLIVTGLVDDPHRIPTDSDPF